MNEREMNGWPEVEDAADREWNRAHPVEGAATKGSDERDYSASVENYCSSCGAILSPSEHEFCGSCIAESTNFWHANLEA